MEPTADVTERLLGALDAWSAERPDAERAALQQILVLAAIGAEFVPSEPSEVSGFAAGGFDGLGDLTLEKQQRLQMYLERYNTNFAILANVLRRYQATADDITSNLR
jgi:hypothetical protein